MSSKYDDIINLPHHISQRHPQMSQRDRAAQFAPFAALTGHDAAIEETARLTDSMVELGEDVRIELDRKQHMLLSILHEHPEITVTYFQADERKSGGAYVTVSGNLKDISEGTRCIVLAGGKHIHFDSIIDIESSVF